MSEINCDGVNQGHKTILVTLGGWAGRFPWVEDEIQTLATEFSDESEILKVYGYTSWRHKDETAARAQARIKYARTCTRVHAIRARRARFFYIENHPFFLI